MASTASASGVKVSPRAPGAGQLGSFEACRCSRAPVVHALCEEPHLEHEQLKLLLGLLGQLLLLWLLTTVAGRSPELKSFQPGSPPTSAGSHLLECSADPELKALLCAIFNERYRTVHARAPGVLSSPFGLFVFIRGGSPLCTRLFLSFMLV